MPCAWYLPHPRSQPPQETGTRAPFCRGRLWQREEGWSPAGRCWAMEAQEVALGPFAKQTPCSLWVLGPQRAAAWLCSCNWPSASSWVRTVPAASLGAARGSWVLWERVPARGEGCPGGGWGASLSLLGLVASTLSLTPFPTGPSAARAIPVSHPGQK